MKIDTFQQEQPLEQPLTQPGIDESDVQQVEIELPDLFPIEMEIDEPDPDPTPDK
jgi:hypothetical protein